MKSSRKNWIALVDCNNFFVSCERLFRPDLTNTPVVVLSSNDGCVVARSPEVKQMGIPMGVPYFEIKHTLAQHGVVVFSSNFSLYRNLSRRVMNLVTNHSEHVQIYSVDEAFFTLSGSAREAENQARALKQTVERATGIPVSVGIARTKTLAKLANERAKKDDAHDGVFCITEHNRESVLCDTAVSEIWGIGAQTAQKLRGNNLVVASDLSTVDLQWIRSACGLHTARTALELRGTSCFALAEKTSDKKGLISSRSFGAHTDDFEEILKAVSSHIHTVGQKLRAQGNAAQHLRVSLRTSRHHNHQRHISGSRDLLSPTSDTFELLQHAEEILESIYLPGFRYAKAGISLSDFSPADAVPDHTLFYEPDHAKHKGVMKVLDSVSAQLGPDALFPASLGVQRKTNPKSQSRSPDYTGSWSTIPIVRANR